MKVYIVEKSYWVEYEGGGSSIVFASVDKEAAMNEYASHVGVTYANCDGAGVSIFEMENTEKITLDTWSSEDSYVYPEITDTSENIEEYPF